MFCLNGVGYISTSEYPDREGGGVKGRLHPFAEVDRFRSVLSAGKKVHNGSGIDIGGGQG